MPSKKKTAASGRASPGAEEPADGFDEAEAMEEEPEVQPAILAKSKKSGKGGKKSKKAAAAAEEEEVAEAAPPRKKKKKAPVEEEEVVEEEEEEAVEEDGDEAFAAAAGAIKEFRKETKKLPKKEELAEAMGIDADSAAGFLKKYKSKQDGVTNARKAKRASGYNNLAMEVGMGAKGGVDEEAPDLCQGRDSLMALISMPDCVRLSTFQPLSPELPSYTELEFKTRAELMGITLPESAAREVQANADAVFKQIVCEAVQLTMQQKHLQKVKASTLQSVIKKYSPRMMFTSMYAAPGLVAYGKEIDILEEAENDKEMLSNFKKTAGANLKASKARRKELDKDKADAAARREAAKAARLEKEATATTA